MCCSNVLKIEFEKCLMKYSQQFLVKYDKENQINKYGIYIILYKSSKIMTFLRISNKLFYGAMPKCRQLISITE